MRKINPFKKRKVEKLSAIFFLGIVLIASCKKNQDNLGLEVQPQSDQLNVIVSDTTQLITYSAVSDSIRTDELTNNNLLGSYVDPFYGSVKASVYTQIRLDGAVDFTPDGGTLADIQVDSVILYMKLNNLYGDIDPQDFEIYQILEDIYEDSSYYSNSSVTTSSLNLVEVGQGNISPNIITNGTVNGEEVDFPVLRIPLSIADFATPIVNESGSGVLAGNDATGQFLEWFKGIKITVNNPSQVENEGGIFYVDLLDTGSKITMYFRDVVAQDTSEFDFNINDASARFNEYELDQTGTDVEVVLQDSTQGEQLFFMQTMGGPRAKIFIPNLEDYAGQGNVIVNKAVLKLPTQFYVTDNFTPPSECFIILTDTAGKDRFLPDYTESQTTVYDYTTASYTFDITRYVNQVLSGELENGSLSIIANGTGVTANRVVFNGSNTLLKDKPKLVLTFSEY
ncbi:MAG: hypothetical protein ACI9N1_001560 [Flavobacteriales bacterium]|jgi:hypothetical protein